MKTTEISKGWMLRQIHVPTRFYRPCVIAMEELPAVVPGHVHLDLYRNGVIADPLTRLHEHGSQWIDETDWTYKTTFEFNPDPNLPSRVLRFEGLDTVCEIILNEEVVGTSDNMFVPLEVDVSSKLNVGPNELEVRFCSAVRIGMERRDCFFSKVGLARHTTFMDERAFVRKAQYMSGWDWGPRLVSAGIWRPVRLIEFESRIVDFHVRQKHLGNDRVRVWSETNLEGEDRYATCWNGHRFEGDFDLVLEAPNLWWPNNEGEAHLYSASVALESGDRVEKRIGIRTIELRREPDQWGESFEFVVNGRPIFARGANWIPNDSFPSRLTRDDYWNQVGICRDLNMNMLRVWGGGLYESDDFYDACDELGILVWQDFPFACSYYPDDDEACVAIRGEAEANATRLRDRASLALWCGNNECQTMWEGKWGPAEHQPPRYFGDRIYDEVLPEVVERLNQETPYIPSSPIGSKAGTDADCNAGGSGDQHFWDAWHGRGDWIHYADSTARFCSEFGFASSCSRKTWLYAAEGEMLTSPEDPIVRSHDKTNKPWTVFKDLVELHFGPVEGMVSWINYSQLNQREALKFAIEHFRTAEFCRGALIWQFNDCWPAQSWSMQDFSRMLKPAGVELKRLFAPLMLSIQGSANVGFEIWLSNEMPTSWSGNVVVSTDDSEEVVLIVEQVGPRSSTLLTTRSGVSSIEAWIEGELETRTCPAMV